MANPQPDKHTRISNEVMDALTRFRIPGEVRQIVDAVIRKTWGWNKKDDEISNSQFVEATGMNKANVRRAVAKATTHKLVVIQSDYSYRFNKDYEQWVPFKSVAKVTTGKSNQNGSQSDSKSSQSDYKMGAKVINTKDNKDILQKTIPAPIENIVNEALKLFGSLNPSYEVLFKRKNQRDAVGRLLAKFGINKLKAIIDVAVSARGQEFAPLITTPCQLEDKLGALINWWEKNNKKPKVIRKIR